MMAPAHAQPMLRSPDNRCPPGAIYEVDPGSLPDDTQRGAVPAAEFGRNPTRIAAAIPPIFDQDRVDESHTARDPMPNRLAHAPALRVVVVENEAELCDHVSAWQDLADHAIEANVFYEPWLLRPALKTLHGGTPLRLVFIYETCAPETPGASRLCGFFPLEPDVRFRILPVRAWRLWKHMHCFLCTPLIRAERARETLAALLQWAGKDGNSHVLDFSHVHGDGPFHDCLLAHIKEAGTMQRVTNRFSRASWKAGKDFENYLEEALSPSARKEYRRQRKRLGELGRLEFRTLREHQEVDDWLEEFLRLEASGWKAREGQALGLNANQRSFVRIAAQAGFSRGQVLLQGLFLDGRPVAMLLSFLAGSGGFAFKIAYDESLAKYSPGVQMMLDILNCLHCQSRIAWMDSCAEPDHPMINRLWKGQKVIESVLVSTGNWRGDLAVSAFPAGQRLIHLIRAIKKMKTQMKRQSTRPANRHLRFPIPETALTWRYFMHSAELNTDALPIQASAGGSAMRLLDIEPQTFRGCFDRKPFLIGHELTNHPLFEISRLMRLCRSLPETSVEYNAGNIPISVDPKRTPSNGLSAEETIRRIVECKSWLVLKYVEQDPEYGALLHRCLAEVARHSEPIRPGMCLAQGFIFISSPGSVTPYHMDPEHNFLLQIRGSKRIHLFDGHDRSVLSEEELEQFYCGGHRNLAYPTDYEKIGWTFDLNPGFGMHFPVTAPHFVRNGAEVSVSFSITFRTLDLKRRRLVHICNAFLRRRGLQPAPAGTYPRRDSLKYLIYGVASRIHRLFLGTRRAQM